MSDTKQIIKVNSAEGGINRNGFYMGFENGFGLSVQWGAGNYCSNQDYDLPTIEARTQYKACHNAEVAVFDPSGAFVAIGGEDVHGWVSVEMIPAILLAVQGGNMELVEFILNDK